MRQRRSKAFDAAATLTALGLSDGRADKRQPRQASAAPGRGLPREEFQGEDDTDDGRPSKTALKRVAHDLQDLGDALASLPPDRLAAIEMDEGLRTALEELRRTRTHEGRRRQRQYVGKLMRTQDVEPLVHAVAEATVGSARETVRLHRLEALRAELVAGDEALTAFMNDHPDCDVQQLRSLIRNARREAALPPEQRHGRAWRELFQFIKGHVKDVD